MYPQGYNTSVPPFNSCCMTATACCGSLSYRQKLCYTENLYTVLYSSTGIISCIVQEGADVPTLSPHPLSYLTFLLFIPLCFWDILEILPYFIGTSLSFSYFIMRGTIGNQHFCRLIPSKLCIGSDRNALIDIVKGEVI